MKVSVQSIYSLQTPGFAHGQVPLHQGVEIKTRFLNSGLRFRRPKKKKKYIKPNEAQAINFVADVNE